MEDSATPLIPLTIITVLIAPYCDLRNLIQLEATLETSCMGDKLMPLRNNL